jgi:cytochrome c oxidase subunit 3
MIWWKNTSFEANKEGLHQKKITNTIKKSIILFIVSEVLFFLRFFWSFFHSGISPSIEIGIMWPPQRIKPFNPINVPLLNTIILIRSGFSVTWSHHEIIKKNLKKTIKALTVTIILGAYFTALQSIEYIQAEFALADSCFGTIFFIATGFHGAHVLIGTTFLIINLIFLEKIILSSKHHIGFEIAAWYWHFVDVVWLFLYLSVYWW